MTVFWCCFYCVQVLIVDCVLVLISSRHLNTVNSFQVLIDCVQVLTVGYVQVLTDCVQVLIVDCVQVLTVHSVQMLCLGADC